MALIVLLWALAIICTCMALMVAGLLFGITRELCREFWRGFSQH